jgi:hypothetical protein
LFIVPISHFLFDGSEWMVMMAALTPAPEAASAYRSTELERIQSLPNSPFGMQFFIVPVSSAPLSSTEKASTRTCDETTLDGKSKLDCIDNDD